MKRSLLFLFYGGLVAAIVGIVAYLSLSFVVQRGPEVAVPAVEGLGLAQALDVLDSRKLDLEVGEFEFSDRVPENHVVRQRPAPGRVIKAGRPIRVILSRGAEKHPVPDVAGLSLDEARIQFVESGLQAQVSARVHAGPAGQIVAQGAEPGTRLLKGTVVALVVSSGPKPTLLRMPSVEGMPLEKAIVTLDEAGLRVEHVEEARGPDPQGRGGVLSQQPEPGSPVAKGSGIVVTVAGTPGPPEAVEKK
jgi:serine/threonine-protein kinase